MTSSRRRFTALAVFIASALLIAACGDDDTVGAGDPTPTATVESTAEPTAEPTDEPTTGSRDEPTFAAEFPVTVSAANGEVTLHARPERIVSLSPTSTEILFAIGAGDSVVAVDSFSDYPQDAPVTDLNGFTPNVEAVAEFEPDLVVLYFDPGDVVSGLEALGIPTILHPAAATLDDVYAQIEQLGAATGNIGGAAELVASMQAEIDDLLTQVPERPEPLTYYHELGPDLYSITSDTFVGEIYALVKLQSIADAVGSDAGGYLLLSEEFVLDADPDLIFLSDTQCCDVTAESIAERPGWDALTAVREGNIVELNDDVASRWGPRVVELLEAIVSATAEVGASAGG